MRSGEGALRALRSRPPFRIAEIAAALVLCLLALLFLLLPASEDGTRAVVRVRGEIVRTLPLDRDARVEIVTEWGTNVVVVEDGRVFVEAADCPSQTCVRTAPVCLAGQRIVCAPHFLTVTVEGASDLDAII